MSNFGDVMYSHNCVVNRTQLVIVLLSYWQQIPGSPPGLDCNAPINQKFFVRECEAIDDLIQDIEG
jgi:hypothetical protein